MSSAPAMPLAEARAIAEEIVAWLAPVCERIEIAGSIRREVAQVHDIEIICVPKIETTALDLFGQATDTRNLLDDAISDAFTVSSHRVFGAAVLPKGALCVGLRLDKNGGSACGARYKRLTYGGDEVALDLFSVLPPAQWGIVFALRTGPAEFSRRLVTQKAKGGLLPDWLRVKDGQLEGKTGALVESEAVAPYAPAAPVPEERDFFVAIGLPWIEPKDRR